MSCTPRCIDRNSPPMTLSMMSLRRLEMYTKREVTERKHLHLCQLPIKTECVSDFSQPTKLNITAQVLFKGQLDILIPRSKGWSSSRWGRLLWGSRRDQCFMDESSSSTSVMKAGPEHSITPKVKIARGVGNTV